MEDIVYQCLSEKCKAIFHGINKEGICCPICRSPIVPIREFKDYQSKDIPNYKDLSKKALSEQMVKEKDVQEFVNSGMLWFINNILHVFGWAIVYEIDNGKYLRIFPARVKFRGFSEEDNTDGYIKVSKYMKANAAVLLNEAND